MTQQQQVLWEKLTNIVREKGMDNIHARELYGKICKLIDMDSKMMISISSTDDGIYHALNLALSHARGEWVLVLGSDDKLTNNTVLPCPLTSFILPKHFF